MLVKGVPGDIFVHHWTGSSLIQVMACHLYPVNNKLSLLGWLYAVGFNHGLPWCVKYMARGPPVTTKPDGEAGGFCGDRRPEGHVFHTSRQAMIKTYYSTSIRKNMIQNCSYFTQMKSTMTAIDDSNRRRNKLRLGCSREATAPLILIVFFDWIWVDILKELLSFTIVTHQNIQAKNITW